jgi:hypothetical protein
MGWKYQNPPLEAEKIEKKNSYTNGGERWKLI